MDETRYLNSWESDIPRCPLFVSEDPVSQAFGHVESSLLVPRGAETSPTSHNPAETLSQDYRVMVDLKANI